MCMSKSVVVLAGQPLTFHQLHLIGSARARIIACPEGLDRVRRARASLEAAIDGGKAIYGVNTGVGAMKDVRWEPESLATFNLGLVRAHHFGTGAHFPAATVRKAIAIRINTLLRGQTGCSMALVDALLALLDRDVVPAVRRTGSIGCADIGLMGQIGTVLTGGGHAVWRGRRVPTPLAFAEAGLEPLALAPRDALAALAVNAVAFAAAAVVLRRAARAVRILSITSLASSAVLGAARDPWRSAVGLGGHDRTAIANWFWVMSQQAGWVDGSQLQDPLSLRMLPQIFGTANGQLLHAGAIVREATAQTDDNPVIISGEVLTSGGSLPLEVSIAVQGCQLVLAHIARNVFNRSSILMSGGRRNTSVNLVSDGVVSTGFGPALKLMGDLYMRVLTLSAPLSPQQLVVANGIEDEASYLPLIIERLEEQVDALLHMAALEALFSAQAIDICGDHFGGAVRAVHDLVRRHSPHYTLDRPLSAEIESLRQALARRSVVEPLLASAPFAETDSFFDLVPDPVRERHRRPADAA
jgi:histidine ammonia-lyase